jgi:AraC family transcriptional regulator, positive regulator of tynA and feaB
LTEPAQSSANLKVVFATSRVHARDRLAYWREEASKAYVAHEFSTSAGRGFNGEIRAGSLGALQLAHFSCDACLVHRTASCLKGAADDDILVGIPLTGTIMVHQDGRDALAGAGSIYFLDPRRPFSFDIRRGIRSLVVKTPRSELQARLGDLSALTARPLAGSNPESALASSFVGMLVDRADALGNPAGERIAQQLLDLLALAVETEMPNRPAALSSSRATTLLRLKAVIEARLHESEFKPSIAAAAAGISVRYANALLAEEDMSLERFIVFRRLQRCRNVLEDPAQLTRAVSDIAYAHGFADVSHFNRRFRSQFGCSPSEHRLRAALGTEPREPARAAETSAP